MSSIPAVEAAAKTADEAQQALHQAVKEAQANGVPDAAIARAAGVTRMTIRRWTGKQ